MFVPVLSPCNSHSYRPKGETLLLGTQEQLRLHVNVKNAGDDAHQARVRIGVPPGVRTESTQIARTDSKGEETSKFTTTFMSMS